MAGKTKPLHNYIFYSEVFLRGRSIFIRSSLVTRGELRARSEDGEGVQLSQEISGRLLVHHKLPIPVKPHSILFCAAALSVCSASLERSAIIWL